jgi:hypothetical protein
VVMRSAAHCHTKMAGELATLLAAVSSAMELVLGCLSDETFRVEVMDKLIAELWRLEEPCLRLEQPGPRIYDLLLGTPLDQG